MRRRSHGILPRAAIAAIAVLMCGTCRGPGSTRSSGEEPGPLRVVLVVVDTERADYTGPYGSRWPTTPWLDEIAREGVKFENAFAPARWLADVPGRMPTGYELEWRAEGRPLHFFAYRRIAG